MLPAMSWTIPQHCKGQVAADPADLALVLRDEVVIRVLFPKTQHPRASAPHAPEIVQFQELDRLIRSAANRSKTTIDRDTDTRSRAYPKAAPSSFFRAITCSDNDPDSTPRLWALRWAVSGGRIIVIRCIAITICRWQR